MRTLRLGRVFDAIFVHDEVMYLTSEADLRATVETAYVHCQPGGVVLLVPDYVRETYAPYTDHGGHDAPDRSLRYLEWAADPASDDTTYTVDFAYLLRDAAGVHVEHDRHIYGLFPEATWYASLEKPGLSPSPSPTLLSPPLTLTRGVCLLASERKTNDCLPASRPRRPEAQPKSAGPHRCLVGEPRFELGASSC